MKTAIEPMHDRVLVERIPQPQNGFIVEPECARTKSFIARVLAVGPGRWIDGVFSKTAVKPGDVVLIPGVGNTIPDWEDGETLLIQQGDIAAIIADFVEAPETTKGETTNEQKACTRASG